MVQYNTEQYYILYTGSLETPPPGFRAFIAARGYILYNLFNTYTREYTYYVYKI